MSMATQVMASLVRVPKGTGVTEPPDLRAITEALTQIPMFLDPSNCLSLVRMIGADRERPLFVPAQSDLRLYLYNVVEASSRLDNGLWTLAECVAFLAEDAAPGPVSEIRRLVSPAAAILPRDDERHIHRLLDGLSVPRLTLLYHAAAGTTRTAPLPRFTSAWGAYSLLLDANVRPDDLPPHLLFVELLARELDREEDPSLADGHCQSLRAWVTEQCNRLREQGDPGVLDRLSDLRGNPDPLANHADFPIYLVIQLEEVPSSCDGDLYRLSHWRQHDLLEWCPERGEDRLISFAAVAKNVIALIDEAESEWAYPYDHPLVLEFILPTDFMNLDLDQWRREPGSAPHVPPLGMEYPVVVRSHNRLRRRSLHRRWRRRWNMLMDHTVDSAIHLVPLDASYDSGKLQIELFSTEHIVACVLTTSPDREPGRRELEVAVDAGLPIILWCREENRDSEFRQTLEDAISGPALRRLPDEIQKLRIRAAGADDDEPLRACRRISLLWDDPNRLLDDPNPLHPPIS